MACRILVPQPGIKPVPPYVEVWRESSSRYHQGILENIDFFFFKEMLILCKGHILGDEVKE